MNGEEYTARKILNISPIFSYSGKGRSLYSSELVISEDTLKEISWNLRDPLKELNESIIEMRNNLFF